MPAANASETLRLDTHVQGSPEAAGPVSTAPLTLGQHYVFVVTGTASIWSAAGWRAGSGCGAYENSPLFPSPGTVNGPTGWDPETVFAVPPGVNFFHFSCIPSEIPFLSTSHSPGGFQVSLTGADGGFAHFSPIGGDRSTPTPTHTYAYAAIGTGEPASFRFVDHPVTDDYGVLEITAFTAAECAAVACESAMSSSPTPKSGVEGSSVVHLPVQCRSHRDFPVHFRVNRGIHIARVKELINAKLIHTFDLTNAPNLIAVGVDLRGLPRGSFRLELLVTTTRGQELRTTRTYHTCRSAGESHSPRRRSKRN